MRRRALLLGAPLVATLGAAMFLRARGVGRDPEPAALPPRPAPPSGPLRVALLGTSISFRQPWTEAARARLEAARSASVTLVVMARPGANSGWGVGVLASALETAPDLVVLEFAINDASLYRGVSLSRSIQAHRDMIERIRATGAQAALMTANPALGRKALERPGLNAYYAAMRALSVELNVGLIDLEAAWRALPDAALRAALPDGLHPAPQIAETVAAPAFAAAFETGG